MEQTRIDELEQYVFAHSNAKLFFSELHALTLHQDQVAYRMTDDDLKLLGAFIKIAGFYGVEITIKGACGELRQDSGENSKVPPTNKA